AGLAQEALGGLARAGVKGAQLLERDEPIEVSLAGEGDGRHPSASDLADDLVAPHAARAAHCVGHMGVAGRAHRGGYMTRVCPGSTQRIVPGGTPLVIPDRVAM